MIGLSSFRFLGTLLHEYRGSVLLILGAGVLSGVFSAAVIAVINQLLHPHDDHLSLLAVGFFGLVSGKLMANILSQLWLIRFAQDAIIQVTVELCRKILQASLRTIERVGSDQLFMTLTDDVGSVVWAAQCVPNLVMNVAMIAGCGFYLLWLSPVAFLGVVGATVAGGAGYYWLHQRSLTAITAAREAKIKTFSQFRTLTDGIKELLMNAQKSRQFLDEDMRETISTLRRCNMVAFRHQLTGESWTQSLYYLLIGLLLLVFPKALQLSPEALTGFAFAMLYLLSPVWGVIGAFPIMARGQVAITRIHGLGISLETAVSAVKSDKTIHTSLASLAIIHMTQVAFSYDERAGEGAPFAIGPIDFSLRPGELAFIVGGNGSGKSTFVKVLAGLYAPASGTVRIGDVLVTEGNRGWYRQHFSVVFSDYHLFDTLRGVQGAGADKTVNQYLELLEVGDKVRIKDGRFSTVYLSQGQRRRLALIAALMEDRPVFVFDEWAADQDPHYKGVFYHTLLPELCRQGKAVVVVTHDDRYFHLGDRVVKLEDGIIVDSWNPGLHRAVNLGS